MASERVQRQIDRLLDEAEEAFAQGDWSRLEDNARRVLLLDLENPDAISSLTAAERALGKPATSPTSQPVTPTPSTAPTPFHPTSFANGRYQVQKFLGEGGKKKVYLAHDTTLDREVAFALIKTEDKSEANSAPSSRCAPEKPPILPDASGEPTLYPRDCGRSPPFRYRTTAP